ncbi:hypothetical protein Sjap_025642 [Stephania japonica]|uniref:Pentatricopeptide repeat-containing protein n=1 Tax=Stephania japonica TaxID=461633 RepID=A0AAP0HI53_9MAGN
MHRYISNRATAFTFNELMRTQVTHKAYIDALQTLSSMHKSSTQPNHFTFPIALKACTLSLTISSSPTHVSNLLKLAQQIHTHVILRGFESNVYSANALITLYSSFGVFGSALQVFDEMPQRSVVSWNSLISGCVRNGFSCFSLKCFSRMVLDQSEACPDSVTMCAVLHAHGDVGGAEALRSGKAAHGYVVRQGPRIEVVTTMCFVENALIDMYVELECLSYAERVFRVVLMDDHDVVTWTTMISGYMKYGIKNLALETFCSMVWKPRHRIGLDPVTVASIMPALVSLRQGKEMHCFAVKSGFDCSNVFVATSLLHMYAEFGNIELTEKQYGRIEEKNVVALTAMITAYAKHARSEDALRLFTEMRKQPGLVPNHLTFMAVLTACNHAGLVDQAYEYFNCMTQVYGLKPDMHHCAAMVDVLGRAGRLEEALEFIKAMPVNASSPIWGSFLASCGLHQDINKTNEVAEIMLKMEPDNPGTFVFLSNTLAQARRWDDAWMVRETMKWRGLKKVPGYSSVHANLLMLDD